MQTPIRIIFRGLDRSAAIEERIRRQAAGLERLDPTIIGCRVTIDAGAHHAIKGRSYRVNLDLAVPGRAISVERDQRRRRPFDDLARAVEGVFELARRQLLRRDGRTATSTRRGVAQLQYE